jgi:hypothetical protein
LRLFFFVVFFPKEPHFSANNILTINTMAGILGGVSFCQSKYFGIALVAWAGATQKSELRVKGWMKSKSRENSLTMSSFVIQGTSHSIKFQIKKLRLSTFIKNFGYDGEVDLKIKEGKISARVEYLGDLEAFWGILNSNGRWNGKLTKQIGKKKTALFMQSGKISHHRMSQVSRLWEGNSETLIESEKKEKPRTKDSRFQIKLGLSPKLEVSGFILHRSGRHYTRIELRPGGRWNAKGWVRLTGGRFLFSAEIGKCQTSFEGMPRFDQ